MINFGKFCEIVDSESQIMECARLMAQMDIEPEKFIEGVIGSEFVEWGGIGRAIKAAGQMAGSLYSGGLKHGVAQAGDTLSGPAVKFDKAVSILKGLENQLRTNPATRGVRSKSLPGRSVAGYIQAIYKALEKEAASMPAMLSASDQVKNGTQYAMRGGPGLNKGE